MAPPYVTVNELDDSVYSQRSPNERKIHTDSHAYFTRNGPASKHCRSCTKAMASNSTDRDPPIVLSSGHGDCRDLATVTPFPKESHNKGLHPSGAQQKGKEVVEADKDIVPRRARSWRGFARRRRDTRRRRRQAIHR